MNVTRFVPADLDALVLQPAQERYRLRFTPRYRATLAAGELAISMRAGEQLLGCAGVFDQGSQGQLWALLSVHAPAHLLALTRAARRGLATFSKPIVTTTEADFGPGCRWLELLGFSARLRLDRYADGRDHVLYARGI